MRDLKFGKGTVYRLRNNSQMDILTPYFDFIQIIKEPTSNAF